MLTGCLPPKYITEKYIKNNLEVHEINAFSSVRLYSIYSGNVYGGKDYLELTGYKIGQKKGLLIGSIKKKSEVDQKSEKKADDLQFTQLTVEQCQMIVEKHYELIQKIKLERPRFNEAVYHDFAISKDLWISFKKGHGSKSVSIMDIWIKGDRYTVYTKKIIRNLKKFIDY